MDTALVIPMDRRRRAGVPLLLLAMALTPFGDGFARVAAASGSPLLVTAVRYLGAGGIGLAVAWFLSRPVHVPRHDRAGIVVRTVLMMGAMTLLVEALSLVPLATATGGFLVAPVMATVLAALVLRERFGPKRWVGTALALAGAVLIARPRLDVPADHLLGAGAAILGGVLLAVWLVATRLAASADEGRPIVDPLSTLVVQSLLGSALLLPLALYLDGAENAARIVPWPMLPLGLVTAACHFLTVSAYARSEASLLSPLLYANLAFAVPVGLLWFGEWPDPASLLGFGAIAAGGLLGLQPERRSPSSVALSPPLPNDADGGATGAQTG